MQFMSHTKIGHLTLSREQGVINCPYRNLVKKAGANSVIALCFIKNQVESVTNAPSPLIAKGLSLTVAFVSALLCTLAFFPSDALCNSLEISSLLLCEHKVVESYYNSSQRVVVTRPKELW